MATAMEHTKERKRERRRAAAEAMAAVRRRRAQRRMLARVIGGLALIGLVVASVLVLADDGGSAGVEPSRAGEVTVSGPARTEPLGAGDAVPAFTAPAIGGGTVSWVGDTGGPAVISVWAPWCPHCQVELPLLNEVMQDYAGVAFLTVVTSIGDRPGPDPQAFMEESGITAPTAIDDARGTLAAALGIRGFPTLYFVASDGTVVREAEGEVDENALREMVGSLT